MAEWGWFALGAVVVLATLGLGLRLNRTKATAMLALRLAEAYRARGAFETARLLYAVPAELRQNVPEAREGAARAGRADRAPVIDAALVESAIEMLERERAEVEEALRRRGVRVALTELPLEG